MNAQPYHKLPHACARMRIAAAAAAGAAARGRGDRLLRRRAGVAAAGVARALLAAALDDLAARGIALVDAFPFKSDDSGRGRHYHGAPITITARFVRCSNRLRDSRRSPTHENVTRRAQVLADRRDARAATARCCRTRSRCSTGSRSCSRACSRSAPGSRRRRDTPFWLFAPWPLRWTRFDVIANVSPTCRSASSSRWRRGARRRALRTALAFARRARAVVRDGDAADVPAAARREPRRPRRQHAAARCVGGARRRIGWCAPSARATRCPRCAHARRSCPASSGDLGLALLALWLVAQINPGIPLFAVDVRRRAGASLRRRCRAAPDTAAHADRGGGDRAFQVLGVGLFLALLLRERRFVGGAVLLLIGVALLAQGRRPRCCCSSRRSGRRGSSRESRSASRPARCVLLFAVVRCRGRSQVALCAIALLVVAAAAAARVRPARPRARRSRCSTGATAICSTSTA